MIKKIVVLISIMLILTGCEKKPENNVSPRASEKENVAEISEDEKEATENKATENNTKKHEPKIPIDYLYAIEKFEKTEEEFEENRRDNEERANYDNIYIDKKIVAGENLLGDLEIPFNVTMAYSEDKLLFTYGLSEDYNYKAILCRENKSEFIIIKNLKENDNKKYIVNDGSVFLLDDNNQELIFQNGEESKRIKDIAVLFKENKEGYEYVMGAKYYTEFIHPKSEYYPAVDIYFIALDNNKDIIMKDQIYSGMAGGIRALDADNIYNEEIENLEYITNIYQNYYAGGGYDFAIWEDRKEQEVRLYERYISEGMLEEDIDEEMEKSYIVKKYHINSDGEIKSETIKNRGFLHRMLSYNKEAIIEIFGQGSYDGAFDYYTRYYDKDLEMGMVYLNEADYVVAIKLKDVSEIEFLKGYKKGMTYDEIAEEFKEYEPAKIKEVKIYGEEIRYGIAFDAEAFFIVFHGDSEEMPGDYVYICSTYQDALNLVY